MKNLFIMHTQYNLILSAAVMSRSSGNHNTLILWSEFALSNEMESALDNIFDRVLIVSDKFVKFTNAFEEIDFIKSALKKIKCLKNEKFDKIYMSQERIFDLIICRRAKRNNPNAVCIDIEEDAYYSINNKFNQPDYVHTESYRIKIYKFLYRLFLLRYPYNNKTSIYCYGMSDEYDEADLLFPQLARRELLGKKLTEITKDEILKGIDAIYSWVNTDYPESEKYMVMFFFLMERYRNKDIIKQIAARIIEKCKAQGRTVLVKYHPRETEKFSEFEDIFEIDKIIPAEKVLFDLRGKDVSVIGNATTACIVAAKLGYSVKSICKIENPENMKMHEVMAKMGINCISDISEI